MGEGGGEGGGVKRSVVRQRLTSETKRFRKENNLLTTLKVGAFAYEKWALTRGTDYSNFTTKRLLKKYVKFICYESGAKKKYEFPVRILTPVLQLPVARPTT